jgi:tRNA pseudouridine38-40 synthase
MEETRNIKLILEYDGTHYHGWQRQKKDITIQSLLEDTIGIMTEEDVITIIGSGRTDAGVHALGQVCNFITRSEIAPVSMRRGLNSLLPEDIFIREAVYVPMDFHSRYSAKSKTYEYRIWNRKERNVFLRDHTWHVGEDLDLEEMRECLRLLIGKHDFSAFKSTGSNNKDPIRKMIRADFRGPAEGVLYFDFEAQGFLRHMVRNIMGTLIDVGKRRIGFDEFVKIFQSKDRRNAGIKAPAKGLFLKHVTY